MHQDLNTARSHAVSVVNLDYDWWILGGEDTDGNPLQTTEIMKHHDFGR